MDVLAQIAHTLLYEGYVLWPYRRSAVKNQQRWTFGGVYPKSFAATSGGADRAEVRAEVLLDATSGTRIELSIRFLHVVARQIMRGADAGAVRVSELTVGTERYLSWDEAREREIRLSVELADEDTSTTTQFEIEAGETAEPIVNGNGCVVGSIVRRWERLEGQVRCDAARLPTKNGAARYRLGVTVANAAQWLGGSRADVVRRTLVSMHLVLRAGVPGFVSLLDPPATAARDAVECRNVGLWPVLVGEEGARDTMLASPIILYDYPRVAPESPGDLFDGGEIDQLLILNIATLTEEEQREMRATDPRAREILDRCASLTTEELSRLHGTVRAMRPIFTGTENVNARDLV